MPNERLDLRGSFRVPNGLIKKKSNPIQGMCQELEYSEQSNVLLFRRSVNRIKFSVQE